MRDVFGTLDATRHIQHCTVQYLLNGRSQDLGIVFPHVVHLDDSCLPRTDVCAESKYVCKEVLGAVGWWFVVDVDVICLHFAYRPRYIAYPAYHTQATRGKSCISHQNFQKTVREITREIANGIGSVDSWRLLQDMYRKILLGKASWQNLWIMKIHDISLCFIASSSLHRFPVLVLLCQGFWERLDYERIKYQTVVRWAANESLLWPPCSKAWQKDSCYIHSNVATTDIPPLSTISCQISTGLACHVQDKACQDAFYQEEDRGNTWQWQVEIETAQSQNENLETYVVSTRSNAKDTNHGERIECKPQKM